MTDALSNQQDAEKAYLDSLLGVAEPEQYSVSPDTADDNRQVLQQIRHVEPAMEFHPVNIPVVPFVCQTIMLCGIQFALPLSSFIRAIPWPDSMSNDGRTKEYILGSMQQTRIIDLAGLILPGEQDESRGASDDRYSSVLVLQDDHWALACHEVKDVIMVKPKDVNWRSEFSKRQWLAGTVRDAGYAILDIDGILRLLQQQDQHNE